MFISAKFFFCRNGVHLSPSRQVAHVYYQLFDSKMADSDQLWSVPKLEYDLLRRNASTNGRKTDLIERYILHRKPKHTIYVRYFSILLYLWNVQVAPTENKTSLKLWWRITGACYDSPPSTLKTTREESKMSNFHTTLLQNRFVLVSWPHSP